MTTLLHAPHQRKNCYHRHLPGSGSTRARFNSSRKVPAPVIGELSGLGCAAVWATVATAMRAASDRTSPVMINGIRCTIASVTLILMLLATGRAGNLFLLPPTALVAILGSGIFGQALGDALFVKGMKMIGSARAFPIAATNPLLTTLMAVILLGEQVSWLGASGTVLVVSGVCLLAFRHGAPKQIGVKSSSDTLGLLVALGAAISYATSNIVLKQGLVDVDLLAANLVRLAFAAILLLSFEAINSNGHINTGLDRRSMAIMAFAGTINAFSSLLYMNAIYHAGAAKASVLTSTSPLFALPLSLIFLKERINRRVLIGTLLSVVGIWLVLGG